MTSAARESQQDEISLHLETRRLRVTLRRPTQLCDDPALLLNLATTRQQTLDEHPYSLCSDIFLAAGHCVASFDLPNHGESIDAFGSGLGGMAAAMAGGVDLFAGVREAARMLAEHVHDRRLVRSGRIYTCGTSRGGLAALHALSAHLDINAAAVFSPVTELCRLKEFSHLGDSPIIRASDAQALLAALDNKHIYLAMGISDDVVATSACLSFHARLLQSRSKGQLMLHKDRRTGHDLSDGARQRGAAFLLDIASRSGEQVGALNE